MRVESLSMWSVGTGFFHVADVFKVHPRHSMYQYLLYCQLLPHSVHHILFVHSPTDGRWVFPFGAAVKNAVIHLGVHIFV